MATQAIEILQGLRKQGVDVTGLCTDSRALAPGEVFLAYPGEKQDGRRHIDEALAKGAHAVLWERAGFEWNTDWRAPNLPVADLRSLAGHLAHEVYGRPSEAMWVAGVTGTNGKTSTSQWIAQALERCGLRCAVIGTLGIGFLEQLQASLNTTPDAVLLHRSLAELKSRGALAVSMEASSIGLDQGRVNGVRFSAALFTTLTRDHLDYHRDMERYGRAKRRLFEVPGLRHAVLNMDDVQGVSIASALGGSGVERIGYSAFEGGASRAGLERFLEARAVATGGGGIAFGVVSSWGEARIESALIGRFNVSNLLGVLGMLLVRGVGLEAAASSLAQLEPVPGRLQQLGGGARPLVVVDYAHTPDALEQVLIALKEVARANGGTLAVVFGCGGERDRGKRPIMGAVAARHAERIVITSDNPRGEDPVVILQDIGAGAIEAGAVEERAPLIEGDRARAVTLAIMHASARDVVLLAGKGHERYQEIAGRRLPYSDADEAERALLGWKP